MAEPYKIVIGLEVHVQLLTKTKLFCGCLNKFGLPPNSATCPVCLGLPGSLPVMNEQAFRLALRAALALNCTDREPPRPEARLHQVGPQELLLPGPAEELSDLAVRPAVQPRRLARDQRREGPEEGLRGEEGRHHPRAPRRGRGEEPARRIGQGRRHARGPEPHRHAAAGDRLAAGHELAGGGGRVPRRDSPPAPRDRRVRLRDAGRLAAVRREREHPRPAKAD